MYFFIIISPDVIGLCNLIASAISGLVLGRPNKSFPPAFVLVDNNKFKKILIWNIKGINSQEKWDAIRDKINEIACQIIYLQETKRESFDTFYIKIFCPRSFDKFVFSPSIGASGRFLTAWNSSIYDGIVV